MILARTMKKTCAVCGKEIEVELLPGGVFEGGHFFGIVEVPIEGTGEKKEVEYWECPECYRDALRGDLSD